MTNPYTTLGVGTSASADDIKKAYRKMAHKYHPDKKGGDEAKFKEVNEAYQVLSNPDKKARFDQFGEAGMNGGDRGFGGAQGAQDFNFDMGGMGSIFDMFGGNGGRARPQKGEDLHLQVRLSDKDLGKKKMYEFEAFDACATCSTSGVAPGAKMNTCTTCQGQGRVRQAVRTPFGTFQQVGICSACEGDGQIPEKKCSPCGGTGRQKIKRKIEVHIPTSLPTQYLMAYPQQGNAGPQGAPAGDLTITLERR